jgi:hypothetical protein
LGANCSSGRKSGSYSAVISKWNTVTAPTIGDISVVHRFSPHVLKERRNGKMNTEGSQSSASRWGWRILLAISALLVINGGIMYFMSATPAVFEQDTSVPMDEVRQMFPTVVDQVVREGQTISILLAVIGLMSLMVAWEGSRRQTRWAWNTLWVLFGMVLVIGIRAVLGGQGFGYYYLFVAAVVLAGLVLTRRELTSLTDLA